MHQRRAAPFAAVPRGFPHGAVAGEKVGAVHLLAEQAGTRSPSAPRCCRPASALRPALDATRLAYLLFTSGTTGRPKGSRIVAPRHRRTCPGCDRRIRAGAQRSDTPVHRARFRRIHRGGGSDVVGGRARGAPQRARIKRPRCLPCRDRSRRRDGAEPSIGVPAPAGTAPGTDGPQIADAGAPLARRR